MERSQDLRKKYPLVVAGNLPFPAYDGDQLPGLAGLGREVLLDSFVCFSSNESGLRERLDEAASLSIPFEQIILYVDVYPSSFSVPAGCTVIEAHADETAEDLRHRLWGKIETLRQQRLNVELHRAEKSGLLKTLSEVQRHEAFEQARIAHALAYLYDFTPARHSLCIRLAICHRYPGLRGEMIPAGSLPAFPDSEDAPWGPALPPELVLALCASLTLGSCGNPAQFREAFRLRSALLPFKFRNELKTQMEKILEPFWGGKNAA